ncbi:hypothetical protein L873DRAFT_199843 [Choiromyces venosus 120613-1]|uniref:Uncharacterized protein n=1 Tax=Choiromyces venosus 120613-1 TaxID=1336337 RepID=A0A3N4J6P6_9PEZI|nr:hypothetical protein L873DRAFT_199843 [Choiromyces venosus 120613-1]
MYISEEFNTYDTILLLKTVNTRRKGKRRKEKKTSCLTVKRSAIDSVYTRERNEKHSKAENTPTNRSIKNEKVLIIHDGCHKTHSGALRGGYPIHIVVSNHIWESFVP